MALLHPRECIGTYHIGAEHFRTRSKCVEIARPRPVVACAKSAYTAASPRVDSELAFRIICEVGHYFTGARGTLVEINIPSADEIDCIAHSVTTMHIAEERLISDSRTVDRQGWLRSLAVLAVERDSCLTSANNIVPPHSHN